MAIFTATFSAVAVSAAQDLFEIVAPSNARVKINSIRIGQYSDAGDAAAELLSMLIIRGYTTTGSGGTAVTPRNILGHSTAPSAGSTVARNNTTVAQDGTPHMLIADTWNVMAPYLYLPKRSLDPREDERIMVEASGRLVVRITAPADAITVNGTMEFEESGL